MESGGENRVVRVSVTLERADGKTVTYSVRESDPRRAVLEEFVWNRDPVDDVEAMVRSGLMYRQMKPGPYLDITVRATGVPVAAVEAAPIEAELDIVWNAALDACRSDDFRDAEGALNETAYLRYKSNVIRRTAERLRPAA